MFGQAVVVRASRALITVVPVFMSFVYRFCWDAHVRHGSHILSPKIKENNIIWMPRLMTLSLFLNEEIVFTVSWSFFQCLLGPCPFRSLLLIRRSAEGVPAHARYLHRSFPTRFSSGYIKSSAHQHSRISLCCLCLRAKQPCLLLVQLTPDP